MLPSSFFLELFNDGARRHHADRALPHSPVLPATRRRRFRLGRRPATKPVGNRVNRV